MENYIYKIRKCTGYTKGSTEGAHIKHPYDKTLAPQTGEGETPHENKGKTCKGKR